MRKFGEKTKEYSRKAGQEVRVWQTPKYEESKQKANELLDSGVYGLSESDFWILSNDYGDKGFIQYNGLIISHNGCLKINDSLPEEKKFKPECVIDPYELHNELVMSYRSPAQGIYEIGEVSSSNCKNEYPFAMVLKRLFDRVVLKNSKIAYAGIYSDSEAEEFKEKPEARPEEKITEPQLAILKEKYTGDNLKALLEANNIQRLEDLPALTAASILRKIQQRENQDGR